MDQLIDQYTLMTLTNNPIPTLKIEENVMKNENIDDESTVGIPTMITRFVHCQECRTVFNATFELIESCFPNETEDDDDDRLYITLNDCPVCQWSLTELINQRYFDPFYITDQLDNDINAILSLGIRNEIFTSIICSYCRLSFNTTYTLLEKFTSEKEDHECIDVIYVCETECPGCHCEIMDNIYDSYDCDNDHNIIYAGDYAQEEEEVLDHHYRIELVNENKDVEYAIIQQGKGDCSVININDCLIIYDFGYSRYSPNIEQYLDQIVKKINIRMVFLILSHDEQDHNGGLFNVIRYLQNLKSRPEIFFISPLSRAELAERHIPNHIKVIGDDTCFNTAPLTISFNDGKTRFQVVYPKYSSKHTNNKSKNLDSLVVAVYVNDQIILLTGDQSIRRIHSAIRQLNITKVTIFQFPHHGSKNITWTNIFVPSIYYIISGMPLENKYAEYNPSYVYNQQCQELIANRLLEKQTNYDYRFLVMSQPRMSRNVITQLAAKNILVIGVMHSPYFTIPLRAPPNNVKIT